MLIYQKKKKFIKNYLHAHTNMDNVRNVEECLSLYLTHSHSLSHSLLLFVPGEVMYAHFNEIIGKEMRNIHNVNVKC